MALTRKFLKALSIEDDKIDEIIAAHSETVNALKEQGDEWKAKAERLDSVEAELKDLKGKDNFESQYAELKQEFDDYKANVESEKLKTKKINAYKGLLKAGNIPEKYYDKIIKVTDIDGIELDDNDAVKDADKYKENIQNEWGDFAVTISQVGAQVDTPPQNTGGGKTKEEILAIKDTAERQKAMAENSELFGI